MNAYLIWAFFAGAHNDGIHSWTQLKCLKTIKEQTLIKETVDRPLLAGYCKTSSTESDGILPVETYYILITYQASQKFMLEYIIIFDFF